MNEECEVDFWFYFVNSYVFDCDGNCINWCNVQDIFVLFYNYQILLGVVDVVYYCLDVLFDVKGLIIVDVVLCYCKFDMEYMCFVYGDDFDVELLIMEIVIDRIVFLVVGSGCIVIV